MPMNKEQADELASIVKRRFSHLHPVVTHEPLGGQYPDRHIVTVYTAETTGDKQKDYDIPHFMLFDKQDLQQYDDTAQLLYPDLNMPPLMDEKHIQYLAWLLSPDFEMEQGTGKFSEVEEDTLYVRPVTYGERRYHIVSLGFNYELIMEQNDRGEKYQQRVTLEPGEYNPFLRQLLLWWLDKVKPNQDETARADIEENPFA